MDSRRLAWTVAFFLLFGCKMRQAQRTGLKDYAPGQKFYTATVSARLYVGHASLKGRTGLDDKPTLSWQQRVQDTKNIMDSMNGVDWRPDDFSDESWEDGKREVATAMKFQVIQQMEYLMIGVADLTDGGGAFNKARLISVSVLPEQKRFLPLEGFQEPKFPESPRTSPTREEQAPGDSFRLNESATNPADDLVEVEYTVEFPLMINAELAEKTSTSIEGYVPRTNNIFFRQEVLRRFATCLENPDTYEYTLFRYFNPKKEGCDFDRLNEGNLYFQKVTMELEKNSNEDPGSPAYDKIWQDNKLVATFVFGRSQMEREFKSKTDAGTKAYQEFLAKVRKMKKVTSFREKKYRDYLSTRVRLELAPNENFSGKRLVDLQVLHLIQDEKVKPEMLEERSDPLDLFMYNGHSGYGNNVKDIEKVIQPATDQYMLFFLNGCWTYAYTRVQSENQQVIANQRPAKFKEMSQASYVLLSGLMRGETYEQIMHRLPKYQQPVLAGEPRQTCPKPPDLAPAEMMRDQP